MRQKPPTKARIDDSIISPSNQIPHHQYTSNILDF